jgi:hypothetical protein
MSVDGVSRGSMDVQARKIIPERFPAQKVDFLIIYKHRLRLITKKGHLLA